METKWSVLVSRAKYLEGAARRIREELEELDRTPFGMACPGCDTPLATEGDFARHFGLYSTAALNVGYCPVKRQREELTKRKETE